MQTGWNVSFLVKLKSRPTGTRMVLGHVPIQYGTIQILHNQNFVCNQSKVCKNIKVNMHLSTLIPERNFWQAKWSKLFDKVLHVSTLRPTHSGTIVTLWSEMRGLWVIIIYSKTDSSALICKYQNRYYLGLSIEVSKLSLGQTVAKLRTIKDGGQKKLQHEAQN